MRFSSRTRAILTNTKKRITNLSVAAVMAVVGMSSAAPMLFTQKAFADTSSITVCASDCDYTDIQSAVDAASVGGTINVGAGTYTLPGGPTGGVLVNKAVSLIGTNATVVVPDVSGTNAFNVQADDVTISGFTITGPADGTPYTSYAWGGTVTRGIFVYNGWDNFTISNNTIKGLRNDILVDGRNNGSITNNVIDNSKSGISVQYTDAGLGNTEGYTITLSGNSEGEFGNEWGLNSHLNGHYDDATTSTGYHPNVPNSTLEKIATYAPSTVQEVLLANSSANDNWTVQDQGYAYQNRTTVYAGGTGASDNNQGSPLGPVATIQKAVDAVVDNGNVVVAAGTYDSFKVVDRTGVTVAGAGAGATIIAPTTLVASGVTHKYTADMKVSVFVNNSTDVTLSGMTVKDNGSAPGLGGPDALVFWNASTGTLKDSDVDADYTINGIQTGQGIAVDAGNGETTNLTLTNVNISGFQKNGIDAIDGNGSTAAAGDITVTVTGGTIAGAGSTTTIAQNGILVWNRGGGAVNLSVTGTTIKDFVYGDDSNAATGVLVYGEAEVDQLKHVTFSNADYYVSNNTSSSVVANDNWWGHVLGVDTDYLDGDVVVDSWCSVADCSATLTKNSSNITVLPNNSPVDLSDNLNGNEATVPGTNDVVVTGESGVEVWIPAGTKVTAVGSGSWDGKLAAPHVGTANVPGVSGNTITITSAIKVGSDNFSLTFDQPVRLVFPGQTGSNVHVGFQGVDGVFHEITTVCDTNLSPAAQLVGSTHECKYDTGTGMIVWTDHFTTFATYTQTAVAPASSSSSSSSSTSSTPVTVTRTTVASTTGSSDAANDIASVLGAASGIASNSTKKAATTQSPEQTDNSSAFLGLGWWWLLVLAAFAALLGVAGSRYLNSTDKR